jgi:predicted regulator of Ras-like GTPase activity (Roadblock/LC7/MglB family)
VSEPRKLRSEAPRDLVESAFTPLLRRLRDAVPAIVAAVFVDTEGECIDYVSAIDPYEAKVNAAHMLMMLDALRASREKVGFGEPMTLEVSASERDVWVQRVGDEYVLVVLLDPDFDRTLLRGALAVASEEFRNEVGIALPMWDASRKVELSVDLRESKGGWEYAPKGYRTSYASVSISDVIGRWTEPGAGSKGDELVCFRVRTTEGQELTLVHDPDGDGWIVRDS